MPSVRVVIPVQEMLQDFWCVPNVLGAQFGDASVLKVNAPAFVVRDVSQKTFSPGVENTIFVTMSTNVDLAAGSEITVAGLIGSNSSDDAALPLTDIRVTLDTGVLLSSSTNTSVSLPTPFRDNLSKINNLQSCTTSQTR